VAQASQAAEKGNSIFLSFRGAHFAEESLFLFCSLEPREIPQRKTCLGMTDSIAFFRRLLELSGTNVGMRLRAIHTVYPTCAQRKQPLQ